MKTIKKILKNKKGFTLIELVVVIAVLGMIAVVAVPKIAGITDKAKTNSDAQMIAVLNEAVERYVAESGDDKLSQITSTSATTAINSLANTITYETKTYGPYLDDSTKSTLPSGAAITYASGKFSKSTK